MASGTPATPSTKETTNYARLCRVLVDVGACALRDCFDSICTPKLLHTVLAANKPKLEALKSRKIINATQWGKLFPAISTSVSSKYFDITLLVTLLRNICGLTPPGGAITGWDELPDATDLSREADIARVKFFRNTVYAHAEHASVEDAIFNKHWKDIRDTLVRLGGVTYEVAIDDLVSCCMDPDMELHYKELLHQWKIDEDNIKDELKEIGLGVKEITTDVKDISTSVKELTKKIDHLAASNVNPVRETNDGVNGIKPTEILETSSVCTKKSHENELLTFYCEQCKVCICNECRRTRHYHHPTVDIHQAAEKRKIDIEEIVEKMKREIAHYEEYAESTRESLKRSRERITTVRKEVMKSAEELRRLLHEHEKAMLTSLDKIERKEQREHEAKLQHYQGPINVLQDHVERFESILQRKKSVETLQANHDLIERCRGLINAERLNIYKPSHARYEVNKKNMEKARSALLALGKVIVITTDPLTSMGLHEFELGSKKTFKIMTNDADGNRYYNEQDLLDVEFQSPSGKVVRHKIVPSKDGEYSVTYKPDYIGKHKVLIAVNGEPLTGSPWRVHVTPHPYKYLPSLFRRRQSQCDCPSSIAIDEKSENVAVTYCENRVQLFQLQGTCLTAIKQIGTTRPTSVAFTKSGELIVVASNKIARYDQSYKFIKHLNNKHLKKPEHLSIAPDGRMVVCDSGYNAVNVLSSDGLRLLLTISDPDRVTPWYAVFHQNMFFVSYPESGKVKVLSENGVFLFNIGPSGSGDGHLSCPVGLVIDRFNNLVVCDQHKARLQIFTLGGKFLNTIEGQQAGFTGPCSVAVSRTGQLFVTGVDKDCVYTFQ